MATEIIPANDFFKLAESHDEKQIMDIAEFREVLCYKDGRTGKHELSYKGIKHLVLEMAAKGFPLEVVESKVELVGEGKEKTWYATIKLRNQNTKLETLGDAEQPYYENDSKNPLKFLEPLQKDSFARRKALSKAERNASKKQLPEAMITHLVNQASKTGAVFVPQQASPETCKCVTPMTSVSTGICMHCSKKVAKK